MNQLIESLPTKLTYGKPWHRTQHSPCAIVSKCCGCNEFLPITRFYRLSKKKGSRQDILGSCRSTRCDSCSVNDYLRIDHRLKLLYSAKRHAREKGVECTLTIEDIVIPSHCPVLGFEMKPKVGEGRQSCRNFERSPSIDRIDNARGYTPDNICVISARANHLKSNATIGEVEAVLAYMKKYADRLNSANGETNDSSAGVTV